MANSAEDSARGIPANTNGAGGPEAVPKPFLRRVVEKFVSPAPPKSKAMGVSGGNTAAKVPAIVPAAAFGQSAAQLDPAEVARMQRDAIDASYFAELEITAERAIKNPKRKLVWRPAISPNDEEWTAQREKIRGLIASRSIGGILDTEFEAAQKSLLLPALMDGPLLEVQLQNATLYKDFFKPGARFHGTPDNMLTKLTMLKFGLPVEALTEMNINRCDNPVDEDDPPDGPEAVPAVERIIYSQRPLEFLDSYHERSFGFPIMRRPKLDHLPRPTISQEISAPGFVGVHPALPPVRVSRCVLNDAPSQHNHTTRLIFPTSGTVNMRGGAGSHRQLDLRRPRYIYGKDNEKVEVQGDSCNAFIEALFTLFPSEGYIGNSKEWVFHIDVYDNRDKDNADKKYQRTVHTDQRDIEKKWIQSIRHLLFNYEDDWILRVQTSRAPDASAPETFTLPIAEGGGSNNIPQKKPSVFRPNSRFPGKGGFGQMAPPENNKPGGSGFEKSTDGTMDDDLQPAANFGSEQLSDVATVTGLVYGYHGKLVALNTEESFLRVALILTGQYPADARGPSWTFDVDIPSKNSDQRQSITMVPANWSQLFSKAVLPFLTADEPWEVFVRYGGSAPGTLVPSESSADIVKLSLKDSGTAYWKIPSNRNSLEDLGINQIQPGFVHAMRLLCSEVPRSKDGLWVQDFSLGVDGLECIDHKFWDLVKNDLFDQRGCRGYEIDLRPLVTSKKGTKLTNVRMIGNNFNRSVIRGDWTALAKAILETSKACLVDTVLPASFRIWKDGPARETQGQSTIINYKPIEEASNDLNVFFGRSPQSHTIWFRPEWESFEIQDVESSGSCIQWDSRTDQSLQSFKKALGDLWKESDSFKSFCITEVPRIHGRDIRFIITEDTTEEDWRLYVFDWLHSRRLAVKRNMNVYYVIDKTSPWGLMAPKRKPKNITFQTPPQTDKHEAPDSVQDDEADPLTEDFISNYMPTRHFVSPKVPAFNKTRILKPTAGRAKAQKYATWLADEQELDDLQLQSYTKDQSVVIPGKLPAAPVYGPSRQLQIKVSPNFPTVYAHRLTPSDIDELADENQTLRNKVLERMWACPICNASFKGYKSAEIREHTQEHIKQIQEAGDCPMCGTANWSFMSMDERREHFAWHMAKEQDAARQQPWLQLQCPACDIDFSNMRAEAIVEHCLKHDPRIIKYCDKCGLHEEACTDAELVHHRDGCRKAPERRIGDPEPIFCESCGKDTSNQTQIQVILHERDCQNAPTGSSKAFCKTCGLDISALNNLQLRGHNSRCTIPRGTKRKFCARCATNISELDATNRSRHKRACRPNMLSTPPQETGHGFTASRNVKMSYIEPNNQFVARSPTQIGNNGTRPASTGIEDLGSCPMAGCHQVIGAMDREGMFIHFQSHSTPDAQAQCTSEDTFRCPLRDFKGEICNQELSLDDFRYHYDHKGTVQQQLEVQLAGQGIDIRNITGAKKHKLDDESVQAREVRVGTGLAKRTSGAPLPKRQKKYA